MVKLLDNEQASVRLRDMPQIERPQERLEKYGSRVLKDTELLAMLLRKGCAHLDVLGISNHMIAEAGSLAGLISWSTEDFMKIPGIGKVKALQLVTTMEIARRTLSQEKDIVLPFETPDKVYTYMAPIAIGLEVEKFWVLCLNRKNRLIKCVEITSGTVNSSLVHPREVFREAIKLNSSAIIAVHNHPSGDPTPSKADTQVTREISNASKIIGIDFLDHIILGQASYDPSDQGYYSFNHSGMML